MLLKALQGAAALSVLSKNGVSQAELDGLRSKVAANPNAALTERENFIARLATGVAGALGASQSTVNRINEALTGESGEAAADARADVAASFIDSASEVGDPDPSSTEALYMKRESEFDGERAVSIAQEIGASKAGLRVMATFAWAAQRLGLQPRELLVLTQLFNVHPTALQILYIEQLKLQSQGVTIRGQMGDIDEDLRSINEYILGGKGNV